MMTVMRNMLTGHAAAYYAIHDVQPNARVGLAHNMRILDPADPQASKDRRAAEQADRIYNQAVLTALGKGAWTSPLGVGSARKLRGTLDWIGLNYYARDLVAPDRKERRTLLGRRLHSEDAEMLDGDIGEFYPYGIFRCIRRLSRLGLPIYVTENGIPDDDDDQRPRYLLSHLHQVWRAIQRCYPVMGYYHWTLADSFEWANGRTLRYGLFETDHEGRGRIPRPSASLYANVIRANAISPAIIDAYAPRLLPDLLPGRRADSH
jgi:beta-glucosidase